MNTPLFTSFWQKVDPSHTAVIVVDIQNDFCADGGWFSQLGRDLRDIQAMVPRLEAFIEAARSCKVPVIFVRLTYDDIFLGSNQKERTARKKHGCAPCLSGTWGHEFYRVKPEAGEVIVTKHRYDAFVGTNLDVLLKSNGIHTLLMTGVTTECCVESTARHGFFLGYYVVLVDDCCGTYDPGFQVGTKRIIEELFGVVSSSREVLEAWSAVAADPAP